MLAFDLARVRERGVETSAREAVRHLTHASTARVAVSGFTSTWMARAGKGSLATLVKVLSG
jgi:hypothetical protein